MNAYDKDGNVLNSAYSKDGTRLSVAYAADGTPITFDDFLDTAVVTALTPMSLSGIKQGACTDGTYIYQISFTNNQYKTGTLVKYGISDGIYTTKTFDETIPFNHGNDMAYNPNTGHIYVAAMSSDGAVIELDTDLNYVGTHYLVGPNGTTYQVWGLCYDRKTNRFLSEYGTGLAVYDQSFNYLSWFEIPPHPSATGQGMETDGDYIYRVTYNPNLIDVATMEGAYVATIDNPMSGEPETLMYDWATGKYYVNKNESSGLFYEVQLKA